MKKDTTKLIKNETKLFSWIDDSFENWKIDEGIKFSQKLTEKIPNMNFVFKDVFKKEDAISQSDIIDYVKKHQKEIGEFTHFFLLKNSQGDFFVANVDVGASGELEVDVDRFEYSAVWYAEFRPRLVVPQLADLLSSETFNPLKLKISYKDKNYKLVEI